MSQVWLITGSSRGLGREFAIAALEAGHKVAATARKVTDLANLHKTYEDRVLPIALDVTKEAQASEAVETTISKFGRLDVLVNNAGYGNVAPVEDTSLAEFREQIETNLTPDVINTPARIDVDIRQARSLVRSVVQRTTRTEQRLTLDALRSRDDAWQAAHREDRDYRTGHPPPLKPTYWETLKEYESKLLAVPDPTTLIIVDEADRLSMNSLEQLRSVFDKSGLGMVLIGMPGIEKRVARYPQLFSRIGFVHEFRPLSDADIQVLLEERWAPVGIHLPALPPNPEVMAAVIRLTRGNFRLLVRLLTQMERVLAINKLQTLSVDVVQTARENLVIGQA